MDPLVHGRLLPLGTLHVQDLYQRLDRDSLGTRQSVDSERTEIIIFIE